MAHILLVDDDVQYRSALKGLLVGAGHFVDEAEDGLLAQKAIQDSKFDLVVSDIRMPNCDGVQLLKWVKAQGELPVVLITGFSEILEATEASQIGADGFLAKPFRFDEIESLIKEVVSGTHQASDQGAHLDDKYSKVPVESFITGSNIHFNIYHRISGKKYLKIANRGEDILDSRVDAYKSKGMRNLYLTKEDYGKYVGFNLDLVRRLGGNQVISPERKKNFMRYTAELIMQQVFVETTDKVEFEGAKEFIETTLDILQEQDQAFSLLESLNKHADFLYAHSLGVSIYSVILARHLRWHWTPKLFKISLAGLLHDIGMKEIPREMLEKQRMDLTQQERGLFETHAARGMEILNQVKAMSDDVILATYQHHENHTGQGYPQHLPHLKIHPIAKLLAVVDAFCDHAIQRPGFDKLSAIESIQQMMSRESTFDPQFFLALKQLFKFDQGNAI